MLTTSRQLPKLFLALAPVRATTTVADIVSVSSSTSRLSARSLRERAVYEGFSGKAAHSPTLRCDCRRQQRSCRRKSCQSASAFAVVHALTIHWTPTHTTLPLFTRAQMHPVFALVSQNSDTSVGAAARVTITDGCRFFRPVKRHRTACVTCQAPPPHDATARC